MPEVLEENPFDLWGLKPVFQLPTLESDFLAFQKKNHPDLWVHKPQERPGVEVIFAKRVWAYEQLKNPATRAQWILKAVKIWPPVQKPALLQELLELQEGFQTGFYTLAQLTVDLERTLHNLQISFEKQDWAEASQHYVRFQTLQVLKQRHTC